MKRYDLAATGIMNTFADGKFVLYSESAQTITALKEQIALLTEHITKREEV